MRSRYFEHLLSAFGAFPLMPILTLSPDVWLGLSCGLNYNFRQRLCMHFSPSPFHPRGIVTSGVPRDFVRGVGGSTNSDEDRGQRERGSGGGSPLVRSSGGSCNLVQEISFHIVKFS
jgi:hypothetical protein